MSYIGKLSPTVGNGLGGLPERKSNIITTDMVNNTVPIALINPTNIASVSSNNTNFICPPLVFGNKVYILQSPDTSTNCRGYLYIYDEASKTFTQTGSVYTSPIAYNYSQRAVLPIFDEYCLIFYSESNPSVIKINNLDNTLAKLELSNFIPTSGTYTNGGSYTSLNTLGYLKKIEDNLVVLMYNSSSAGSNGIFILNNSMQIVSSFNVGLSNSESYTKFKFIKTPYGYCVGASYGGATQSRVLSLKTFNDDFTLLDSYDISKNFGAALTVYNGALCETGDGLSIGLIVSGVINSDYTSSSGIASVVNSSGMFDKTITYSSDNYWGATQTQYSNYTETSYIQVFDIDGFMSYNGNNVTPLVKHTITNIDPKGYRPNISRYNVQISGETGNIGIPVKFKCDEYLVNPYSASYSLNTFKYSLLRKSYD